MTTPTSPGFLAPNTGRVTARIPTVLCRGRRQSDPGQVQDWDYDADLHVERDLDVDLHGLLSDIELDAGSVVCGVLTWTSSVTRLRGAGPRIRLQHGANSLQVTMAGHELGGTVTISTRVLLDRAIRPGNLSPRRQGSTLWGDLHRIQLEGGGARFPTIPLAFSTAGIAGGRNGAWWLDIRGADQSAAAGSALTLYLNVENAGIQQLLAGPTEPGPVATAEFLRFDVTRQLLTHALTDDELDLGSDHHPGSLGEVLALLVRRLFPGRDHDDLRAAARRAPGELDAELQAALALLHHPEAP